MAWVLLCPLESLALQLINLRKQAILFCHVLVNFVEGLRAGHCCSILLLPIFVNVNIMVKSKASRNKKTAAPKSKSPDPMESSQIETQTSTTDSTEVDGGKGRSVCDLPGSITADTADTTAAPQVFIHTHQLLLYFFFFLALKKQ